MKYIITEQQFKLIKENYLGNDLPLGTVLPESDIYISVQKLHSREEDFYDGDLGDRIEEYSKYKLEEINISEINIDEWQIDDDLVDDYIKEFSKTKSYPPIVLGEKNSWGYTIIDGTHRVNALDRIGIKTVRAWVGVK